MNSLTKVFIASILSEALTTKSFNTPENLPTYVSSKPTPFANHSVPFSLTLDMMYATDSPALLISDIAVSIAPEDSMNSTAFAIQSPKVAVIEKNTSIRDPPLPANPENNEPMGFMINPTSLNTENTPSNVLLIKPAVLSVIFNFSVIFSKPFEMLISLSAFQGSIIFLNASYTGPRTFPIDSIIFFKPFSTA